MSFRSASLAIVAITIVCGGVLAATGTAQATTDPRGIIGAYTKADPALCNDAGLHLVPCGRHCDAPGDDIDESEPCTICHFIVLGHNIVKWVLYTTVFLSFAALTFAGIMYIVSAGNQSLIGAAKSAIWAALIGLIVVLAAWVIINTIIAVLLPVSAESQLQGNWFSYRCTRATPLTAPGGTAAPGGGGNPAGGGGNPAGGGGNPAGGGGNPAGGGGSNATGLASKVNPATYVGTKYCDIDPVANGVNIVMNSKECYTDQTYCQNRFGEQCTTFAQGSAATRAYPSYRIKVNIAIPSASGTTEVVLVDRYIAPSADVLNPAAACQAVLNEKQPGGASLLDTINRYDSGKTSILCNGAFKQPGYSADAVKTN